MGALGLRDFWGWVLEVNLAHGVTESGVYLFWWYKSIKGIGVNMVVYFRPGPLDPQSNNDNEDLNNLQWMTNSSQ